MESTCDYCGEESEVLYPVFDVLSQRHLLVCPLCEEDMNAWP